jgi:hypothetical protein
MNFLPSQFLHFSLVLLVIHEFLTSDHCCLIFQAYKQQILKFSCRLSSMTELASNLWLIEL